MLVEDEEGALWTMDMLDRARVDEVPAVSRIVVAVDPPVTGHAGSDACGIIVVGAITDGAPQSWRAVVLEAERIGSTTAGIVLIYSLSFCEALTFLARSHADVSCCCFACHVMPENVDL